MKCDEVQSLLGPYLDSELDARTALEIQQHLKTCADCARIFAEEEQFELRMKTGLSYGTKTATLWQRVEEAVRTAPPAVPSTGSLPRRFTDRFETAFAVLLQQLRAGFRPSRLPWTALAAVWLIIFVLNFSERQSGSTAVTAQQTPSATQMRLALKQQKLLMADLVLTSDSGTAPASETRTPSPSPHSERNQSNLNS